MHPFCEEVSFREARNQERKEIAPDVKWQNYQGELLPKTTS